MINPFISNSDGNYLFRKNYQFIARPPPAPAPPAFSASKLNYLHSRNPFQPNTAHAAPNLPARSLSNSRAVAGTLTGSTSREKLILGKSRLIDEADGWKRELESQERGKLQAYGAEGLRYNAYTPYSPNHYGSTTETEKEGRRYEANRYEEGFNDYYASYTKPIEPKDSRMARDTASPSIFHPKPERSDLLQPYPQTQSKRVREHFSDEINEQQQSRPWGARRENRYELQVEAIREQSQRASKLADMFGSVVDERFKQSMQHHSYASYYPDDLVESKHSRFNRETHRENHKEQRDSRPNYLYESDVNRVDTQGPLTLTFSGKVYYKIEV